MPVNAKALLVAAAVLVGGGYAGKRALSNAIAREEELVRAGKVGKVGVNMDFVRRLSKLLASRLRSPGILKLVGLHGTFLLLRTFISIYISHLDGEIVGALVQRKLRPFLTKLLNWMAVGVGAATVNSLLRYLENKLALALRTSFTKQAIDRYMDNDVYYRVSAMDSRISNPDQCLAEDVKQFSDLIAHLWSHLSKPVLDILLISYQLIRRSHEKGSGVGGPIAFATAAVSATVAALRFASPPFGKLVKQQAELAGNYRFVHSRLITNAEEIAFYQGQDVERNVLWDAYQSLVKHTNLVYKKRILYTALEQFLLKYGWSASGFLLVAYPLFTAADAHTQTAGERTQDYITARGLLLNAADAIERILSAYKEVTELAGYTMRVSEMLTVFEDCSREQFVKERVGNADIDMDSRGTVIESDTLIKFDNVPIVTPTADCLVSNLQFTLEHGQHVMVVGANGSGKSSLFRVLAGLWPVFGADAKLTKPHRGSIFYVPQKPYMVIGSLRDQVIYPHTLADMTCTDDDLLDIMRTAHLDHIQARHGFDTVKNWREVLSGGEQQRVAFARLFYHRISYAVLDECTAAISMDVEDQLYQHAKDLGISLLTISHRHSLWKHHQWVLKLGEGPDGNGFSFNRLDSMEMLTLREEKEALEKQLQDLPAKQKRLEELRLLLVGKDTK